MAKANRAINKNDLILEYQDFVHFIAGKLISTMKLPKSSFEEYVSAGYLGLVEAAERFDPRQGTSFKNYAFLRIRGAIIDSIRKSSDISGEAYRQARAFEAIQDIREEELLEESQENSPISNKETLARTLVHVAKGALVFRISMSSEELEDIPDEESEDNPEKILSLKQDLKEIRKNLATLSEKERLIIEEYYFKDKSFTEIAREYEGMSKSWVSRLHTRALSKLQMSFSEQEVT